MRTMQAKLFMIPWFLGAVVMAQRDVLTAPDLLVDAHHRHFYEMLRRQQAINDALLLNNALHLHHLAQPPPPPVAPQLVAPLAPPPSPPQLFHPAAFQIPLQQSAKGTYDPPPPPTLPPPTPSTTPTPTPIDTQRKSIAGVKTVHIKRQDETTVPLTTTTATTVPQNEDEMSELFKKLNLSQQETKDIVEHVENLVRAELAKKLREAEILKSTVAPTTVPPMTTTTTTTTVPPTTSTTTAFVQIPRLRLRNSDEFEEVIIRKNTVKHHPMKKDQHHPSISPSSPMVANGAIKTSLTHLPIFVATNEEEDVAPPKVDHNKFEKKRILIASHDVEQENDKDLLVDFATGSPLELSEQEAAELLPMMMTSEESITTSTTTTTTMPTPIGTTVLPRHPHHIPTNFELLASDYRQRLDGTGDISKILTKISHNAYISLSPARGK